MVANRLDWIIPTIGNVDPDSTLPWADATDGLIGPGSLLLFEPNHSANPLSGSPAPGSAVYPNVAASYATAMMGACSFTCTVSGTTLTVSAVASGALKAGQTLSIAGMSSSTGILAQLTGTPGGAGTYQLNVSGTVASPTAGTVNTSTASLFALSRGNSSSGATADTAGLLKTERSTKGGLHVIISQANNTVSYQGFSVNPGQGLLNWILGNPAHQYYFSAWDVLTRAALAAQPPEASFASGATAGLMALYADGTVQMPTGPNQLGAQQSPASYPTLGPRFKAVGMNGPAGGTLATASFDYNLAQFGPVGAWSNATSFGNKSSSRILQRIYVEDLTISGRTYAQVAAKDAALWQEANSVLGRYYGDTFVTNPSTLP